MVDLNLRVLFKILESSLNAANRPDRYVIDIRPDPLAVEEQRHGRAAMFIPSDIWEIVPMLYRRVLGASFRRPEPGIANKDGRRRGDRRLSYARAAGPTLATVFAGGKMEQQHEPSAAPSRTELITRAPMCRQADETVGVDSQPHSQVAYRWLHPQHGTRCASRGRPLRRRYDLMPRERKSR
jgi:hypothetical protein